MSYLDRSLLICGPLHFLSEIVNSPKASDTARVQTCNALLDRGWGKATIFIRNVETTSSGRGQRHKAMPVFFLSMTELILSKLSFCNEFLLVI